MADQEQVQRLTQGVAGWNQWRIENPVFHQTKAAAHIHTAECSKIELSFNSSFHMRGDNRNGGTTPAHPES